MRVHVFQHVAFEGPGQIAPVLTSLGHTVTVTRADRGEAFPEVASGEGLVVMGGPMSVNDELGHRWLREEKRRVADAVRNEQPVLGICLGAQLIAAALGARVYRNAVKEIGWHPVTWRDEARAAGLVDGAAATTTVFHWHGETFDLPAGARWVASSAACAHQGFLVGERALGLQFHLEVGPVEVDAMVTHLPEDILPLGPTVQDPVALRRGATEHRTDTVLASVLKRLFGTAR